MELFKFGFQGWWWKLHWALSREFRDLNISKLVNEKSGGNPGELSYGETPAMTLQRILTLAELPPEGRFVDLGMGRGLAAMAAACLGYRGAGIEVLPEYLGRAQKVADRLKLDVDFRQGDMLNSPWPAGDLYLLNSTAFPASFREQLVPRLKELEVGSLVVTYDWELTQPEFDNIATVRLPVTWGTVECRILRSR